MSIDDALGWIEQIAQYRNGWVRLLSLTGGEPFIDLSKLKLLVASGTDSHLMVTIVTNAYWAETPAEAKEVLGQVRSIAFLQISTDRYHLLSIPLDRVRNAALAAKALEIPYNISICTESDADPVYRRIVDQARTFCDNDHILTAITFRAGRAAKALNGSQYSKSLEPPESACPAAASPIIFPNGRVVGCIGPVIDLRVAHPLLLGDLRSKLLAEIFDRAEVNPVLHALRIWGPRKLVEEAKSAGLEQQLPTEYIKASTCNACYALMTNPSIRSFLEQMSERPEFVRKIAYARAHYLKETLMLERLNWSPVRAHAFTE